MTVHDVTHLPVLILILHVVSFFVPLGYLFERILAVSASSAPVEIVFF